MPRRSWLYILPLIRRPPLALPPQTCWEWERETLMIDIIIIIINMPTSTNINISCSIYMTRHSSLTSNTPMRNTMAFPQRHSAPNYLNGYYRFFLLVLRPPLTWLIRSHNAEGRKVKHFVRRPNVGPTTAPTVLCLLSPPFP